MDFMIITGLVMLVSVLLTHKLANYWGLALKLKPLFLCAVCALLINFALPAIALHIAKYHLIIMFSTVLCAAFFIAKYNEKLALAPAALEPAELACGQISPARLTGQVEIAADIPPPLPSCREFVAHLADKPARTTAKASVPELAAELLTSNNLPAIIVPTLADWVKADMENVKLIKLTAVLTKLTSLDAILDYACDQKHRLAYANALFAFKQALDRYESDSYAPFIVIEIGNIYKNTGLYDEAIVIYNRAFLLPAVMESKELQKEFHSSISYLRIIKTVLLKFNYPRTAFNQIPPPIMHKIESEFTRWRIIKYAS